MKTKLQKFIDVRQSIVDEMDPLHPDWKHHCSFLMLAQAIQAEVSGMVATDPPNVTEASESAQSVDRSEDKA